jgi:predicted porin
MKQFNKTKIAAAVGTAALAMTLGAPANAAISLGGDNGWEVTYGGFINLFYTQSDWDFGPGVPDEDSAHLNEGLLPAFHTLTVKSPTINGLTGTGQITFAPDSSQDKRTRLNKPGLLGGDSTIDMREVFFNVDGSFGTISAGRTLSLFQRQAILKDYTLFGVGALAGPDGSGTALGRIGFGYVYPDFRTRFAYVTPNINGFQLSVGVFDPQEPLGTGANVSETDTPQFQAEATYNTAFGGGNISAWAGFLWQDQEIFAGALGNVASSDVESFGVNLGLDITYGGFNVMGSWYDGEALGTQLFNIGGGNGFGCVAAGCEEADNDGFIVQGSYTFNGKTKLGVSYGESSQDASAAFGIPEVEAQMWTVGVYHDVNSWLKLIAEYSDQDTNGFQTLGSDAEVFSVGGFLLW